MKPKCDKKLSGPLIIGVRAESNFERFASFLGVLTASTEHSILFLFILILLVCNLYSSISNVSFYSLLCITMPPPPLL